ncbi:MAG: hypothetical protein FJ104_12160, partial [Deltaproteobacteria bacterium]|nr:hypothetical protein [Deltaproteobacteria bacterium]
MQVLLYQPAYERVAGSLATGVPAAEPLVMASDGSLTLRGAPIAHEDAAPEVAWANRDVYDGGPVREFMVHCLKSQTLRFVQSSAAGFEHPVFSALVDKGIRLANSDASSISIAEFVLASVLAELHPGAERRAL